MNPRDGPPPPPQVHLTRIEKFSSAHRLHRTAWSDHDNVTTFGKCNNVHGHNYTLEVTIKGGVCPSSGMVMNIAQLKQILEEHVLGLLDHKNIDVDVDYFRDNMIVSTSENLAVFIWHQIEGQLPDNVKLQRVKLFETDKNIVEYYGE